MGRIGRNESTYLSYSSYPSYPSYRTLFSHTRRCSNGSFRRLSTCSLVNWLASSVVRRIYASPERRQEP